jgi:hypothetical protein
MFSVQLGNSRFAPALHELLFLFFADWSVIVRVEPDPVLFLNHKSNAHIFSLFQFHITVFPHHCFRIF